MIIGGQHELHDSEGPGDVRAINITMPKCPLCDCSMDKSDELCTVAYRGNVALAHIACISE